ncbi:MAG: chitobiase/beta-hexosaminidase C-terminal domain-containing protein [Clostridia bacterium]|nr:chitobiase/beta-hexosaminidase C-terminal domain-containing protein [Clostridia bacterium]
MKKIICAFLSVIMVLALFVPIFSVSAQSEASPLSASEVAGDEIKVMSLNIRVSYDNTSQTGWVSLKWVVGETESGEHILRVDNAITEILKVDADVICFQEYSFKDNPEVDTKIADALYAAGYGSVTVNADNQTPIFYKEAKFTVVNGSTGTLQYTYQKPVPTTTNKQVHVKVSVKTHEQMNGAAYRLATTKGGVQVKELFDRNGTTVLTEEDLDNGNYLDLTNIASTSGIVENTDGTVQYNEETYDGLYHTRAFVTAKASAPVSSPDKSLTWAILQHTNGRRILMMSTHLVVWVSSFGQLVDDYTDDLVKAWRQENVRELFATVDTIYEDYGHLPTIITGDFNARNDDPAYSLLCESFDDAARLAPDAIYWEASSFELHATRVEYTNENGDPVYDSYGDLLFDVRGYKAPAPNYPVDHVFFSQSDLKVTSYDVLNDTEAQRLISDHYALVTKFILPAVATPASSHKSAIYRMEQTVTLTKGNDADVIYYTLDGSDPVTSATRQTYNGALKIYGDVQLRAVASRDGQYSLERTVNFATGAELIITEVIKNNQSSLIQKNDGSKDSTADDVFVGFEVVNTSAHTLDLGRYTLWCLRPTQTGDTADTSSLNNPNLNGNEQHLFVNELNTYFLEPGETAFIWLVTEEVYSYKLYYTEEDADFAVAINQETGKVTYNTELAKAAFELSMGTTVDVDVIVPLDITAGAYAAWKDQPQTASAPEFVGSTVYKRPDAPAEAFYLRSGAFDSEVSYITRTLLTYNYEATAANAFASAAVALPEGYSGTARQGSFYITNTLDPVTGKVVGLASAFTYRVYGLGTLEAAEQTLADNMVRDLSLRKVTWIVDGAETVTYAPRNVAPTTAVPSKPANGSETFTFAGWSPMPAACEADSTGTYLLPTEATYVAQFYSSLNTLVVTFLDGAGELADVKGVAAAGGAIVLPAAPAGNGSFVGWKDASGNLWAAGASYNVTAELTFTPMFVSFTTTKGASVRTNADSTGIRFLSALEKEDYDMLMTLVTSVKYGTFIAPQSYVDEAGAFDVTLFRKHLDVKATGWYDTTETDYVIAGSVANIKTQNYLLDYAACAYLTITYADGTEALIYAQREENRGYKVYDTAYNAFNDRTLVADDKHDFQIESANGTTFSPYSGDELATIRNFMDPVLNIGIRDGKIVSFADTEYYTSPLNIPETWVYNDTLNRIEITGDAAWGTVYACYMENDVAALEMSGNTLYIAYSGDSIYSDFY